jgi:hypothetical protein
VICHRHPVQGSAARQASAETSADAAVRQRWWQQLPMSPGAQLPPSSGAEVSATCALPARGASLAVLDLRDITASSSACAG